jgi:hypothetical protein
VKTVKGDLKLPLCGRGRDARRPRGRGEARHRPQRSYAGLPPRAASTSRRREAHRARPTTDVALASAKVTAKEHLSLAARATPSMSPSACPTWRGREAVRPAARRARRVARPASPHLRRAGGAVNLIGANLVLPSDVFVRSSRCAPRRDGSREQRRRERAGRAAWPSARKRAPRAWRRARARRSRARAPRTASTSRRRWLRATRA